MFLVMPAMPTILLGDHLPSRPPLSLRDTLVPCGGGVTANPARHESMAIGGMCHAAANLLGPEDVFVNTMRLGWHRAFG